MEGGPDVGAFLQDESFKASRGNITPAKMWVHMSQFRDFYINYINTHKKD